MGISNFFVLFQTGGKLGYMLVTDVVLGLQVPQDFMSHFKGMFRNVPSSGDFMLKLKIQKNIAAMWISIPLVQSTHSCHILTWFFPSLYTGERNISKQVSGLILLSYIISFIQTTNSYWHLYKQPITPPGSSSWLSLQSQFCTETLTDFLLCWYHSFSLNPYNYLFSVK